MSADAPDKDALITQFTGLTGVAPHEVSPDTIAKILYSFNTDSFCRLSNTSPQISGTSRAQLQSTTPHSKKLQQQQPNQKSNFHQINLLQIQLHPALDEL